MISDTCDQNKLFYKFKLQREKKDDKFLVLPFCWHDLVIYYVQAKNINMSKDKLHISKTKK